MRRARALVGPLVILFAAGCAAAPLGSAPVADGQPSLGEDLVPPGFGTLHQDDVTMTLRSGPLLLKVTPLAEWVIRLTAPDTYRRLAELALMHKHVIEERSATSDPTLFLVSFFSTEPEVPLQPEDLLVVNRGRRHRPILIRGVTSGWESQRLGLRETQMALYAFASDLDLSLDLSAEYDSQRSTEWPRILLLLQTERERARARAGAAGAP